VAVAVGSVDTAAACYGAVGADHAPRAPHPAPGRRERIAIIQRRLMANIHSQKKRILRAERERLENRRYTSTIKTYFRRLEAAVAAGDDSTVDVEHRELVKTIDKAVKRGALHRNTGARKKSRAARVRAGDADAA
jgi:small subunit ribosomal protein S20